MADISRLGRLVSGVSRNVDLETNTLVLQSVKIGGATNTELTKTILDNLIAHLTVGADRHNSTEITQTAAGTNFSSGALNSVLANLDTAIGDLTFAPANYVDPASDVVAAHLSAIDTALASAGSGNFSDSVFRVQDNGDATKELAFEVDAITTGTTRTITMPDTNIDLGSIAINATGISDNVTAIGNNVTAIGLRALDTAVIKKDGSVAFTADQAMGGFKLTGLADGTLATDAATKGQVDASAAGMLPKDPVELATTGDISLTGEQTIDGTLTSATRILVQAQTTLSENGIYVTATGAWVRAADADGTPTSEIQGGNSVFVNGGTVNGNTVFRLTGSGEITVDVGAQDWIIYSRAEEVSASTGLEKVGLDIRLASGSAGTGLAFAAGVLSVNVDDSTIEIDTDTLRVKADGILNSHINSAAAIVESKLTLDFGTSALNTAITTHTGLSDNPHSVTKAQILVGHEIVDADVAAGAAIATSKLADSATIVEAKAFFDASDISGAEAETLTDGSDAGSLHKHNSSIENMQVGETMPASGAIAVRMGIVPVAGETEGRIYISDPTQLSVGGVDPFHCMGLILASSQAAASYVDMVKSGKMTITSHGLSVGLPVYLGSNGVLTSTAPSAADEAVVKVGMARDTNTIEIAFQIMGVN